jgi:hypothetical protein
MEINTAMPTASSVRFMQEASMNAAVKMIRSAIKKRVQRDPERGAGPSLNWVTKW